MSMAFDVSHNLAAARPVKAREPWPVIAGGKPGPVIQDEAALALQRIGTKRRYAKNEAVFSEGDEAKHSYKVVTGAIRLCKHLADGRRQIAGFVLPGEYCGLLHLEEHRFTAEAASELVVIAYPQRQVEALSETMLSMRKRLAGFLAQRLKSMQDHVVMLGRQTAKERVASFLLNLVERSGAHENESAELPMSRQDIADYLGLTIETVCRVLSELKRSRILALPGLHEIVLKDTEALQALAEDCE
jgi:CRP/FNR family nitrogen fixation transcriptional regulator